MQFTQSKMNRSMQELARRVADGIDVTLFWDRDTDRLTVCVCDQRRGEYFEISPAPTKGLDAFYHPYSYEPSRDTDWSEDRLAA
jgi:hypothetical protein